MRIAPPLKATEAEIDLARPVLPHIRIVQSGGDSLTR